MKSPGHKPRHLSDEEIAADHELRRLVRRYLRQHYPDLERPPGPGWLYAPSGRPCLSCDAYLLRVHVPNVNVPGLAFCPGCKSVTEGDLNG